MWLDETQIIIRNVDETEHAMKTSRIAILTAGLCLQSIATQAAAEHLCVPDVAFKEVRTNYAASQRTWTGTLAVDAGRCATTSGRFELSLVRLKETAPDVRFIEQST